MISLYKPEKKDLWFRKKMLGDEKTMSYNHAWGGTIAFEEDSFDEWYDHWVLHDEEKRFYVYLKNEEGNFAGEAAYHYDENTDRYLCDVIVYAPYRKRGYGTEALRLLCSEARKNGIAFLCDNIALDNPAVSLFLKAGFMEEYRDEEIIMLKKDLSIDDEGV